MDNSAKIKALITHFYGKQNAFAETMGVSVQVVNNWCKRGIKNVDIINTIIEKTPGLNPAFLTEDIAPLEIGGEAHIADNGTVIDRLLSIIEQKDKQIDRLIALLEEKQSARL